MKQIALALSSWTALVLVGVASCSAPGGPGIEPYDDPRRERPPEAVDALVSSDAPTQIVLGTCVPAKSAEKLPARVFATGEEETTTKTVQRTVFVDAIYSQMKTNCGGCHLDGQSQGNFQTSRDTFTGLDVDKVVAAMISNDPKKFMPPPPNGKPYSERQPSDPIVELVTLLNEWKAKGKPANSYQVPVEITTESLSYLLAEEAAEKQTNLGSCIPDPPMVATEKDDMDQLDAVFETANELPDRLDKTDLVSMDGEVLAKRGVISFAPAYPLWSEDSGKMRAIRVPRGKSVKFDKATQSFDIPPNTRFYKTFLKEVINKAGKKTWQKMETRLIVARRDLPQPGGPDRVEALFGTYAWNPEETEAILVKDPLRNGEPFRDRLFPYKVDEPRFDKLERENPGISLQRLAKEKPPVFRHYAIPGKQRCVECHMGSPMANFVLGFTPLQIRRRPKHEAGVYEEVGPDELNQLDRLIKYGVITGLSSASEIRGLEEPQGTRKARNKEELTAQAYLLGNCSHCHNPRGFPSVKESQLKDVLDFLPSAEGGIFEFRLDKTSPLRKRGVEQNVAIPYITPSLRDFPVAQAPTDNWMPKWVPCKDGDLFSSFCDRWQYDIAGTRGRFHSDFPCQDKTVANCDPADIQFISAPWRSLIYRNVDAPFSYVEDNTIFPHMPRHSAGFDCRAPRILGDWMVSIPALHKDAPPDNSPIRRQIGDAVSREQNAMPDSWGPADTYEQPYEEVKPGDRDYDLALEDAKARIHEFQKGRRYQYCPDRRDIVDLAVLNAAFADQATPQDTNQFADAEQTIVAMPPDSVPDHAHWVVSDFTEPSGDWVPRKSTWAATLVNPQPLPAAAIVDVPTLLQQVRITPELKRYAVDEPPIPFGFWKWKEGCDFSGERTATSYSGAERPRWLDVAKPAATDIYVYKITPGEAVFQNICINCHGEKADSKGLLAEAIAELTGGNGRVANFKDGLFGPVSDPGANIDRVFGPIARMTTTPKLALTAEDWAARYMTWMAMGGTNVKLPRSLLALVSLTSVVGQRRGKHFSIAGGATPNMLQIAQEMCQRVLPYVPTTAGGLVHFPTFFNSGKIDWTDTGLLGNTGDAEMWLHLCSMGNRPVVRVPVVRVSGEKGRRKVDEVVFNHTDGSLFWADDYPADDWVVDYRGRRVQWKDDGDHLLSFCLRKPVSVEDQELVRSQPIIQGPSGEAIPWCPEVLLELRKEDGRPIRALRTDTPGTSFPDVDRWAARGAANAGVAVFLYLNKLMRGGGNVRPTPAYDRCEQIKATKN